MNHAPKPASIPPSTAPFFQEYTFTELNAESDAALIIERILAYGNRAELRWLFDYYGKERIKKWVMEGGVRHLPRRRYHLWCILLDLPEFRSPRQQVWPY